MTEYYRKEIDQIWENQKAELTEIFNEPDTLTGELEVTGNHQNFPLEADSFGFRYFDDEEEQSKEYLKEYKQIGRWFSQMALEERPKVLKQWREMAVEADFEWLHDNFSSKLFKDEDGK
jgi:hypothetical protein